MNALRIAIPGLLAALAFASCGGDTTETKKTIVADLCAVYDVVCEGASDGESCDPVDAVCKCGGAGGMICQEGTVCNLNRATNPPSVTCVSPRCAGVICGPFEACDAFDGLCKCNGSICGEGRTCLASGCSEDDPCAGVVCGDNHVCDPSDRTCKCGGSACSAGEHCRLDDRGFGNCVGRKCVGKNCANGTVCNPVDGLCHCSTTDGDVCTSGQACTVEDGKGVCVGHDICDDAVCPGNATCSPLDGKCRCGGYDAAAPVCSADQTCDLAPDSPRCVGGAVCTDVECDSGLSCDDETGECRCGGTGGVPCLPGQGCIDSGGRPTCVILCDPNTPNVAVDTCGEDGSVKMGCYLSPADGMAFCADAGVLAEGAACSSPLDCAAGHHCVDRGDGSGHGSCRRYCDQNVPGDCDRSERSCAPLTDPSAGLLPNLGVCLVVSR